MLTKYDGIDSQMKDLGRFGSASPISGAAYSQRYWKNDIFQAMEVVKAACLAEVMRLFGGCYTTLYSAGRTPMVLFLVPLRQNIVDVT